MMMKKIFIILYLTIFSSSVFAQIVTDQKGTRIAIDSSKWKISGNNIYNKNSGNIGIGTNLPTAQLHTTGTVRFEGLGTNTNQTKLLTSDASGNISTRLFSNLISSSGFRQVVILNNDVTNNNATGNMLEDVTGLSFNVVSGMIYRFYILIPYTSSTSSNGSRWTINTPSTTILSYVSRNTQNATAEVINYCNAPNLPSISCNTSNTSGNLATIEGVIQASVNGTVQVRFASETSSGSITAKAGASLEWW